MTDLPLAGVKVLDLSTLLPGPLATLMLADAGAEVIKLERPGTGDEMRTYSPRHGEASANYAILNRGKRAYAVDLKDPRSRDHVLRLAEGADVVVEQFRPGVVDRLGLGYEAIAARNPGVVYCSITGYGDEGKRASYAGHDLNYVAESGLLGAVTDPEGRPPLPMTVIADIAGGTYPAVVNILLALRKRDTTGKGTHIKVSMAHNLQVLAYGYVASHQAGSHWPSPNRELLTGGSPRYQIYRTADGRYIACAALEEKFWERLTDLVGLPERYRADSGQEPQVIRALADRFASKTAQEWQAVLEGEDVCTTLVATWEEAVELGLIDIDGPELVTTPGGDQALPTLRSPISPNLRDAPGAKAYPRLGDLDHSSSWT